MLTHQDSLKLNAFLTAITKDRDFARAEAILDSLNPSAELIEKLQIIGAVVATGSERLLLNLIQRGTSTTTMLTGEISLIAFACHRGLYSIVKLHLELRTWRKPNT